MKETYIKLKGYRRKIKTAIPEERLSSIKDTLASIAKDDLLVSMHAVYGGGFHPRTSNKNLKPQLKRVIQLHKERMMEEQ